MKKIILEPSLCSTTAVTPMAAASHVLTELISVWGAVLLSFYSVTSLPARLGLMLFALFVVCFLQIGLFLEKSERFLYPSIGALCIVLVFIRYPVVVRGILLSANQLIRLWNEHFDACLPSLTVEKGTASDTFFFWLLMTLIIPILVDIIVSRRSVVFLTIFSLVGITIAALFGMKSGGMAIVFFAAGWIAGMMYAASPSGNTLVHLFFLSLPVGAFILAGGLIFGSGSAFSATGFNALLSETVNKWRYGSDSLPEGNLADERFLLDGDEERLKVKTNGRGILYLRGFVGAEYTGTAWQTLRKVNYSGKQSGMLEWLETQGFLPQAQYDLIENSNMDISTPQDWREYKNAIIENVGANRRYIYSPTTLSASSMSKDGFEAQMDWQLLSGGIHGLTKYSYQYADNPLRGEEMQAETSQDKKFAYAERIYSDFVRQNYLSVDNKTRELVRKVFFEDATWGDSDSSLKKVTSRIRAVLDANNRYVEKPVKAQNSGNFVRQFLSVEKKGNSISFASAAVLAFRVQNIPARYVEGYLIGQAAEDEMADGERELTLTTKNAHAWAEVYIDGIGWMPVETTPGFYSEFHSGVQIIPVEDTKPQTDTEENNGTANNGGEGSALSGSGKGHTEWSAKRIAVIVSIAIGAAILLLFLILELQRFFRRATAKRKNLRREQREYVRSSFRDLMHYLEISQVEGDQTDPMARSEAVEKHLVPVTSYSYQTVIKLMQKVIYGEQELTKWELRTIRVFMDEVQHAVKSNCGSLFRRLYCRYIYAF